MASWLKKSTSITNVKKEEPSTPPPASGTSAAESSNGDAAPPLPPMAGGAASPGLSRLSMRLPPVAGPPQLRKTGGPGSGIGGSVPVSNGSTNGAPTETNASGSPSSPQTPPAAKSPFFARAAASNGSVSPKHPAFAKAAPPPPSELSNENGSEAAPNSPAQSGQRGSVSESEAPNLNLSSSSSGTYTRAAPPGHRDRKSFHPAFAAAPPPKPGSFAKPTPPSRRNRDSLSPDEVLTNVVSGSPESPVASSLLSSSSSYTSSGEMRTSVSRTDSKGSLPEWEDEADYPFNEEDSEKNLIFTPETASQPRPAVKAGKLEKLIERLTYEKYPDPDYVNAFLLTYRSFTTPTELLALLVTRYNVPAPKGADEKELDAWAKNKQSPIQLRVFNVLKAWVQTHFYDFSSDTFLTNTLLDFINSSMMGSGNMAMEKAGEQLKRLITKKMEGNETESEVQFSTPPPKPIVPLDYSSIELNDIDPLEIARQLTLIEYGLYKSIKPWECLGQAWTKKATRDEKAPNIMAMIQRFNSVSRWVTTEILKVENLKKRAATLERFVQIAMGCEKLNNYNAMMEIISGLQCSAIFRLKHTWAACNKQYIKKYEEIHALMSRERNFQKFRDHLHSVDPPCIPYLGVYLTDLTFIEDGNKDYVTDEGLINFDKRRKISTVIREIQQYQQTPYCLEAVPWLQEMLNKVEYWEENETYSASTRLEPKDMAPPQKKKPSASQIFASSKDLLKKRAEKKKGSNVDKSDKDDAKQASSAGSPAPAAEEEKEEEEDFGELEHIEGYRFYTPDSKDNLVFDIDVSAMVEGARPTIQAATLEKLLERLTHENWPDPSLVNTFLLTYRTFTTAEEVLDLLIMRFNIPWPKDTSPELRDRYNLAKRVPIRLRVFNVAKNWVDKYINEGAEPGILRKFEALADLMISDGMDKPGQALKRTIQRQREGGEMVERRMMSKPPPPYLPSNLTGHPTLLDYHPEEIARQLTLIEQKLFQNVKPWEFLNQSWIGADKEKNSPNIIALLQRESRTRMWVITDVVKQPSIEIAAQHITQWIKIAEKSLTLNNFSSMAAIVSALMAPELQKLKFVWGQVSSKNTYNKLKALMEGNYTKLQDKLHNVQPPCLPYLGAYLHNLTEIEKKYPNLLQGLINFEKRTLMATAIAEIQQYQQALFCLEPVPFIQEWIESEEVMSVDAINDVSAALMVKPERVKPIKKNTLKSPLSPSAGIIPALDEDSDSAPTGRPVAMSSSNLHLHRSTSSKLSKLLGKEYDDAQREPFTPKTSASAQAPPKRWNNSISASREGSRESAEELGIDKKQTLKLQLLSMFLDDAEFRQSIQEVLVQDIRKELDEYKTATNAQITSLKEEIASLKAQLPK